MICWDRGMLRSTSASVFVSPSSELELLLEEDVLDLTLASALISAMDDEDELEELEDDCLERVECLKLASKNSLVVEVVDTCLSAEVFS